jgi:glutamate N-acetyltransferase/amino-acid N-acetyltransferase
MISVDGDTSTNDTLLIMANGLALNPEITEEGEDYFLFMEALHQVNYCLARKMAGDGEGATALFTVEVIGADTKDNARRLAKSVVASSLTKAAIFGHDANWGRILCALGYAGASFDPEQIDIYFQGNGQTIHICHNGIACDYSEAEAAQILTAQEVTVLADMHMGQESAVAMGCDLSYDYVKINADYRS